MAMTYIPMTRASTVLPFVQFLDGKGLPVKKWLQRAGITRGVIESPENPVPLPLAGKFVESAVSSEGIPHLGFLVAEDTPLEALGAYGRLVSKSRSICDYLQKGIYYSKCVNAGARYWISFVENGVRVNYLSVKLDSAYRVQDDLFTLGIIIGSIRRFTGDNWSPRALCVAGLTHEISRELKRSRFLEDTRILQGKNYSYIEFDRHLMRSSGIKVLQGHAEFPVSYDGSATLTTDLYGTIRQFLELQLPKACPSIDLVAECAGTSRRTLQRQLSEASLSYSDIVEETRQALACRWLAQSDKMIDEISTSLGYRNPSNFARAFKQSKGCSPSEYRHRHTCNLVAGHTRYPTPAHRA